MTTSTLPASLPSSRGLHIGLWVLQTLLAVAFFGAGLFKATTPMETLAAQMSWVAHTPAALVRFIGVAEVLGAVGLILPAATRILPVLTPIAGAALALVMALAAATHLALGEVAMVVPNLVFGGLAAFIARGRFGAARIAAR